MPSLRNPEFQARLSGMLSIAAVILFAMAIAAAFAKGGFDWAARQFVYASGGMRAPVVYGLGGLALACSCLAFWFAYASAGERRNPNSGLSWLCFAVNAVLITLELLFLAAFRLMAWIVTTG